MSVDRTTKTVRTRVPKSLFEREGMLVSSHPTRDVLQVRIHGKTAYLKREHRIEWRERWRNRLEGFGWVSKTEREVRTLEYLRTTSFAAPQLLGWETDEFGRAAMLVADAEGYVELRQLLQNQPGRRSMILGAVGRMLAQMHAAGIDHADCWAKHVLIEPDSLQCMLIDWQRGRFGVRVRRSSRERSLAAVIASLPESLIGNGKRLLAAYRSTARRQNEVLIRGHAVFAWVEKLRLRSAARDQLLANEPAPEDAWIALPDGCHVLSEWASLLRSADARNRCYRGQVGLIPGILHARRCASRRLGSSSTLSAEARLRAHLTKHGVPTARRIAWGERPLAGGARESFTVDLAPDGLTPWRERLRTETDPSVRHRLLMLAGELLARLHESGCRLHSTLGLCVERDAGETLSLTDSRAIRYVRTITRRRKRADLRAWLREAEGLSRGDRVRFLRAFLGLRPRSPELRRWAHL